MSEAARILASELYVPCPRCSGRCQVSAWTALAGWLFSPGRQELFTCPLCCGTGEADSELAAEWNSGIADDE